jgi:hypothetical protein
MTEHLEYESNDERLIVYSERFNQYGLQDRKDQDAYTPISFCPWCGKLLPSNLSCEPDKPFDADR